MVVKEITDRLNGVADKFTTLVYGEEDMAAAAEPSDDERLSKIAWTRDAIRLFITACVVVIGASVIYFVGKKVGVWAYIKSKLGR